ncbi:MAG: GNAT family N-acetyltransferase [Pseudobdellovibrionaceae bacterium]|jgi:hypothetical protein|nr:GNAT family N-acetyltransferase [Pseudobdellovibrionaceae bacterium]
MFHPLVLRLMFGDAVALPFPAGWFGMPFLSLPQTQTQAVRHFELQQAVLDELGPDQDVLHVRSLEEWEDLLEKPDCRVVSVERDNRLIAQAVVLFPQKEDEADMLDMELPDSPHRVATVCSVVTHPAYRCKALMIELLRKADSVAWMNGRRHMLALITDDNIRSWSQFLKAGYQIVGCGFDPADGSNTFFAHRSMRQLNMRHHFQKAADQAIIIPPRPLEEMKSLFDDGFVGYQPHRDADGRYTGGLVLARL